MKNYFFIPFILAGMLLASCNKESALEPEYRAGIAAQGGTAFVLYSANEGVYPDTSVLDNPNNPFAHTPISQEFKWDIQGSGDAITRFYVWATFLCRESWGEPQLFTAMALEDLSILYSSTNLQSQAIRAYQAVLTYFPYDQTYDPTGFYWSNGVAAYKAIEALGGTPEGFILGKDAGGHEILIANAN